MQFGSDSDDTLRIYLLAACCSRDLQNMMEIILQCTSEKNGRDTQCINAYCTAISVQRLQGDWTSEFYIWFGTRCVTCGAH
jgi:hypothetical protein